MPEFRTIDQLNAEDKTVLLRVDFNVPFKDGVITDTTRLTRVIPTLKALLEKSCKLVLISHLGRPKGKIQPDLSLKPVAKELSNILKKEILFSKESTGNVAQDHINKMSNGDILMLENIRFHPQEEQNDPSFSQQLSELGDIYVNDAFSTAHRAHASTEGISHFLPAYAGKLMTAEIHALQTALEAPEKPVIAIVGGAKISTKLELLNNLIKKVDYLVLGGAMANTFINAMGLNVGTSLCEKSLLSTAQEIIENAKIQQCQIMLPTDVVVAKEFKEHSPHKTLTLDQISSDDMILDIGENTVKNIVHVACQCKTVLWNGPMGAFETLPFDQGTSSLAQAIAELTQDNTLKAIAGGGDTVAALAHADVLDQFSYVSTAGGAFLEWLEGKELPGIKALQAASKAA